VGAHSQILNHDAPEPADSDVTGLAAAMYASKYYRHSVREKSREQYSVRVHRGFFFFFLNLYKATFVCLSVVYMSVDTVYGCERLCGKT
jgi:hypothetical protein